MTNVSVSTEAVRKVKRSVMTVHGHLMEESKTIRNMEPPTRDGRGGELYGNLLYLSERLDRCNVNLYRCIKDLDDLEKRIDDYEAS